MPGRLVGMTTDKDGIVECFCLTLQTREQHIRGAKATSNVCTNQGLMAMRATMFMTTVGRDGLAEMARQSWHKAHYLAEQIISLDGWSLKPLAENFSMNLRSNVLFDVTELVNTGKERGVLVGVAANGRRMQNLSTGNELIIAVTEKRTRHEMDALVALFKEMSK